MSCAVFGGKIYQERKSLKWNFKDHLNYKQIDKVVAKRLRVSSEFLSNTHRDKQQCQRVFCFGWKRIWIPLMARRFVEHGGAIKQTRVKYFWYSNMFWHWAAARHWADDKLEKSAQKKSCTKCFSDKIKFQFSFFIRLVWISHSEKAAALRRLVVEINEEHTRRSPMLSRSDRRSQQILFLSLFSLLFFLLFVARLRRRPTDSTTQPRRHKMVEKVRETFFFLFVPARAGRDTTRRPFPGLFCAVCLLSQISDDWINFFSAKSH